MNARARNFAAALQGVLGSLGTGVRGISLHAFLTWSLIQIVVATDDLLRVLATDLGLKEPVIERAEGVWWHQATAEQSGLRIVASGPHHPGGPPL